MMMWLAIQHPQLDDSDIQWFCELVRPWTLLQLGFIERYPKGHITGNSEYDVLTLWEHLVERARVRRLLPKQRNSRVRFGIGFELQNAPYDWVVLEGTTPSRRLLSGLFKRDDLEKLDEQTVWSLLRLDVVCSMCSDIDTQQFTKYMFVEDGKGWHVYQWSEFAQTWKNEGMLTTISRGSSADLRLRGISFNPDADSPRGMEIGVDYDFENFIPEAKEELDRIKHHLQGIRHVRLSLGVEGSKYKVGFIDPSSNEVIHSITMIASVDLVSLLRWPLVKGKGLNLRSGDRVTWDPLSHDDIDYGALSDFRPLVRTSKTDATTFTVPITLEGVSFKIEVVHDDMLCPVIVDSSDEHDACWRLRYSGVWPKEFIPKGGINRGFTDEEVYDILSVNGTIGRDLKSDWKFVHGFTQGGTIVFNTSKVMRELIFEKEPGNGKPRPYKPKLYREYRKMRWRVSLKMEALRVIWETSHTLGFLGIKGDSGAIDIDSSIPVDDMVENVEAHISKQIPAGKLADVKSLRYRLKMLLEGYHYSLEGEFIVPERIQKEVAMIEDVENAEDVLKQAPDNLSFYDHKFINLASFYLEQGRISESINTLNRAFRYFENTDISDLTKTTKIGLLEMKGMLLKGIGKHGEMRAILQQILSIGETIPNPSPKIKETLSSAARFLNGDDSRF